MKRTKDDTPRLEISAQEADAIKRDKATLEQMAGAGEMQETGYSATSQIDDIAVDKDSIRRKIATLERQLEAHRSQKVTDSTQRNKILERRRYLEEKFKPYLESYRDLGVVRRDDPDWQQAYEKALKRPEVNHLINEWRRLGLMLDPEDPFINDLNKLRSRN